MLSRDKLSITAIFAARLSNRGVTNDVVAKFLIGRCCLAPHFFDLATRNPHKHHKHYSLQEYTRCSTQPGLTRLSPGSICWTGTMAFFRTMAARGNLDDLDVVHDWFAQNEFQAGMRESTVK